MFGRTERSLLMNEYIDDKCPACKFYLWYEDRHEYRCSIKGCWEGSKFKAFTIENWMEELDRDRKRGSS